MNKIQSVMLATLLAVSTCSNAETLTYKYRNNYDERAVLFKCSRFEEPEEAAMEKARREIITENNLPKDLRWNLGSIINEWGDTKKDFCFLEFNGKAYLYEKSSLIFIPGKKEVREISR
jgi:hypothetical protein